MQKYLHANFYLNKMMLTLLGQINFAFYHEPTNSKFVCFFYKGPGDFFCTSRQNSWQQRPYFW